MAALTSFSSAKLEALLLKSSSSSSGSSSRASIATHLSVFGKPCKDRRTLVQRGVIRCDAASPDLVIKTDDPSNASSASALEQFKTSAADRYSKERSNILVIGLGVHTAPVEMREKLAIPEAEWPRAIGELCGLNHIEEAAVLSTCNRMEIYVVALSQHRGVKEVTEWMSKTSGIPVSDICEHRFLLYNKDAM